VYACTRKSAPSIDLCVDSRASVLAREVYQRRCFDRPGTALSFLPFQSRETRDDVARRTGEASLRVPPERLVSNYFFKRARRKGKSDVTRTSMRRPLLPPPNLHPLPRRENFRRSLRPSLIVSGFRNKNLPGYSSPPPPPPLLEREVKNDDAVQGHRLVLLSESRPPPRPMHQVHQEDTVPIIVSIRFTGRQIPERRESRG